MKITIEIAQETFETEDTHTAEQQRYGWQCILNYFKAHVERTRT